MEELNQLLKELANQLGTTIEYLWQVLVYQAYVQAIVDLMVWFIVFVFIIVYWRYLFPKLVFIHQTEDKKNAYEANNFKHFCAMFTMALLSAISLILVVTFFSSLSNIITMLVNPEYWALQQVLDLLK